jgi:hypothetical protein
VQLHVKLDGVVHLRGGVGELAGVWEDDPNLHLILRIGRTKAKRQKRETGKAV